MADGRETGALPPPNAMQHPYMLGNNERWFEWPALQYVTQSNGDTGRSERANVFPNWYTTPPIAVSILLSIGQSLEVCLPSW
jgi:hypothetical protein